ncbi:protein FAR1-RELATED SEQUENCE 2 isoform X2 [Diospyros lotus]|uniref:protein FAR1-RELATED SEQUENCE 2 isoform X2 n=1 Tax=Diospyros lotus TaxID=55363 RepID=UPI00225A58F2|nr:protein FAR1-RELATED SEQUENCE 2 isoform X2 [Diospyros lotus]
MDIDLELPAGQKDKPDARLDTEVGDDTNGLQLEEEEANYPKLCGNDEENLGLNIGENISTSREGVDEVALGLDSSDKELKSYEPQNSLEFDSKEAAYSFYREYARAVGFGITIKASRRSKKSGNFIDVKIACSRYGSKRESSMIANSRSCPKTDCKASMHMKRRQDGKWFIYSFVKEHNHEICPSDFHYALRGRSKQSGNVACQKKGLQLALDEVDVQVLLEYFILMQDDNINFYYAIDLDHENRMRNVFWIDAKSRNDYNSFCDVVFFDSSYIRSRYKVPFLPIVGVNNHFQLILLGCALIGEETASTFVWLMRTWLRAVGGQTPKVIITDEGKSLEEAIKEVLPDARHCFCLWHVLRNIPENLGHKVNSFENFMMKFNKCIRQYWKIEEFEKKWWKMVDKFELRENEWLQSLYENRKKWIPAYMHDTFLAGICTAERSECISSLFDKYIHREMTCKEFINKYKEFLYDRCEAEAKADFEIHHDSPTLRSHSPFEKQMSTVFTIAIFKKFQVEVLGTVACSMQKECEDEAAVRFRVYDLEEQENFLVVWSEANLRVSCSCHSFEYKGFLCRHAMKVLQISGVSSIPTHYIPRRWTKVAKIRLLNSELSRKFPYRVQRFNDLCKRAIELGEKGSFTQETYNIVINALQEAMKHCVSANNSVRSVLEPNSFATHGSLSIEEENQSNNLAKASKKKKLHKKKKVQSETEVITSGMQDSTRKMGQLNSGAHCLDNTFVPQQDILGMEVGLRTPTVDDYYSAQQSVQGVVRGPFNSLSSSPDGYYSSQQGMQGMGQLNSIPLRLGHYGSQQSLQGLLHEQLGLRAAAMHGCFGIHDSLQNMPVGSRQFHNVAAKHLHDKHPPS